MAIHAPPLTHPSTPSRIHATSCAAPSTPCTRGRGVEEAGGGLCGPNGGRALPGPASLLRRHNPRGLTRRPSRPRELLGEEAIPEQTGRNAAGGSEDARSDAARGAQGDRRRAARGPLYGNRRRAAGGPPCNGIAGGRQAGPQAGGVEQTELQDACGEGGGVLCARVSTGRGKVFVFWVWKGLLFARIKKKLLPARARIEAGGARTCAGLPARAGRRSRGTPTAARWGAAAAARSARWRASREGSGWPAG